MNRSTLLAVLGFAGAGAVYYVMANRDTTPVGLTATQFLGGEGIGEDEEGNSYKIDLVLGTFRESESSLSIVSEDESRPLLIVYQNGVPIDGRVIDRDRIMLPDDATNEDQARVLQTIIEIKKEFGIPTQEDETDLDALTSVEMPVMDNAQTQNAESMMLGHIGLNALQSNHCW